MGLSCTGWGKPWSRHRGENVTQGSGRGLGDHFPLAQSPCEMTGYHPAAGRMSTHGVHGQNTMLTHSSQPPSRRFGGFPRARGGEAAEALSWGMPRDGRPSWLLGAAFEYGRAQEVSLYRAHVAVRKSPIVW